MTLDLHERRTPGAGLTRQDGVYRLSVPRGSSREYRLAELDDYANLARFRFPAHPPRTLGLHARASADTIPGTWGFGFWNDPFGMSLGFGGQPFRIPALPNALWFFHASEPNHLSFRDDRPGQGFLAQVFSAPRFHPLVMLAGLQLPFSRIRARRSLGRLIQEDGVRLSADPTQWHSYRLEWSQMRSVFWIDGHPVLETPISPRPPLGLVIWIDNQYAAFRPDGKIGFGLLEQTEPAWLEIKALQMD